MLQVSPLTTHRIAMHGADVIMGSHHRAGEPFQNDAESSRCDVKTAGLEPHTSRVGNPETIIFQVDVGNEVLATPSIRFEAVSETVEGGNWHVPLLANRVIQGQHFIYTTNRFPSPRCASTIQIVRPLETTAETQPQLQTALLRLSAMTSQYFPAGAPKMISR